MIASKSNCKKSVSSNSDSFENPVNAVWEFLVNSRTTTFKVPKLTDDQFQFCVFMYLCICIWVFVSLFVFVYLYLCIYVFVFLYFCLFVCEFGFNLVDDTGIMINRPWLSPLGVGPIYWPVWAGYVHLFCPNKNRLLSRHSWKNDLASGNQIFREYFPNIPENFKKNSNLPRASSWLFHGIFMNILGYF